MAKKTRRIREIFWRAMLHPEVKKVVESFRKGEVPKAEGKHLERGIFEALSRGMEKEVYAVILKAGREDPNAKEKILEALKRIEESGVNADLTKALSMILGLTGATAYAMAVDLNEVKPTVSGTAAWIVAGVLYRRARKMDKVVEAARRIRERYGKTQHL